MGTQEKWNSLRIPLDFPQHPAAGVTPHTRGSHIQGSHLSRKTPACQDPQKAVLRDNRRKECRQADVGISKVCHKLCVGWIFSYYEKQNFKRSPRSKDYSIILIQADTAWSICHSPINTKVKTHQYLNFSSWPLIILSGKELGGSQNPLFNLPGLQSSELNTMPCH